MSSFSPIESFPSRDKEWSSNVNGGWPKKAAIHWKCISLSFSHVWKKIEMSSRNGHLVKITENPFNFFTGKKYTENEGPFLPVSSHLSRAVIVPFSLRPFLRRQEDKCLRNAGEKKPLYSHCVWGPCYNWNERQPRHCSNMAAPLGNRLANEIVPARRENMHEPSPERFTALFWHRGFWE